MNLTNYQVRIVLTSTNFNAWDHIVGSNGEDLRFIDEYGNELSYWIEYFDKVNKLGIIWVKVPYIPASSTTKIYMLYGNPNAQSNSNGSAVFEFFDDFEQFDTNTWDWTYVALSPIVGLKISPEFHDGIGLRVKARYKSPYQYVNVYTKNTWNVPNTYGYIVDSRLSPRTNKDHDARLDLYTASSNIDQHPLYAQGAYIHAWGYEDIWVWYFTPNEVVNNTWDNGINKSFSRRSWWIISIGYFGNRTYYYIWNDKNYTSPYAYKIYRSMYNDFRIVLGNERSRTDVGTISQEVWYDWIRVRKFVYPEPQISIGEEKQVTSHKASILIAWSNLPSKNLKFINISLVIESIASNAILTIQHNITGTWITITEKSVATNTEINEIDITYGEVTTDLGVIITVECSENFIARIDYVSANMESMKSPCIYVLSNGLNELWIYDIMQDSWISTNTPFTLVSYPAMYYDELTQVLWIANGQELYIYDPASSTWKLDDTLPSLTSYGSILIVTNNKIWYGPGGNSYVLYVRGVRGISWSDALMPGALGHYSCVEYNGTHILINFGSSDKFYEFSPITEEWVELETPPTIYCVGSVWDSDRGVLWIVNRGGSIHYYDPKAPIGNQWKPLEIQPPYYPQTEGDRLVYYNNYLYHIRSDGTRELWIVSTE